MVVYLVNLGYRWNPTDQSLNYYLYGDLLPTRTSFSYLGVPFRPGASYNINKSLATMNQLAMTGLNPNGLSRLLTTHAQNMCLHRMLGGSCRFSIKVMLQLMKLPNITEHDALLTYLLPRIRLSTSHSQWYTISKTPLWKRCAQYTDILGKRLLKKIRLQYLHDNLEQRRTACSSNLLSLCRPAISLDPILWLLMTRLEISRCIRSLQKQYAIYCFDMHHCLQIPKTTTDHLFLLLNKLPTRKPCSFQTRSFWTIRWLVICATLHELDHLYHEKEPPSPSDPGQKLLKWLFNSS
ncbi:hypothetical protein BCV72DRAFT_315133 [Rhizopus microsporus var. microsporus]|uniref:Uncharacterized protein n=1 Tax=Rhizopus microsporus var. microsporus TaxID=86635 RepID=A0A1X0RDY4_RHIZD|nr:hypothetical protein BCV72DRAFT_315133 [Rhizopus microsporus var. microsporus]